MWFARRADVAKAETKLLAFSSLGERFFYFITLSKQLKRQRNININKIKIAIKKKTSHIK